MNKKVKIAIGGVIVASVTAIGTYTISLFINTTINEPILQTQTRTNIGFEEFINLSEDERANIEKEMT